MAAKKTLYQVLQVNRQASEHVIRAAYAARQRALGENAAPEVLVERTLLRDALDLLTDPVRRALYDERLREEDLRAMASGGDGEIPRARSANARVENVEPAAWQVSPLSWLTGIALVSAVAVFGSWVYLDYKDKREAKRLETQRRAVQQQEREEQMEERRQRLEAAAQRSDASRQSAEQRRQESLRLRERQHWESEQERVARQSRTDEQRAVAEQRRIEAQQRRLEQDTVRQQQQQLDRERRYLQELERDRPMKF